MTNWNEITLTHQFVRKSSQIIHFNDFYFFMANLVLSRCFLHKRQVQNILAKEKEEGCKKMNTRLKILIKFGSKLIFWVVHYSVFSLVGKISSRISDWVVPSHYILMFNMSALWVRFELFIIIMLIFLKKTLQ